MVTVSGNYLFLENVNSAPAEFLSCFVLFCFEKERYQPEMQRWEKVHPNFSTIIKPLYCHLFDKECARKYKSNIIASKIISCVCEHLNECMQSSYFQKFVGPLLVNNIILQTAEMTLTCSHMETMQYLIAKLLFETKVLGDDMGILGLSCCTPCPSRIST